MSQEVHKRAYRVGQLVQQELGRMLIEGIKDPRVGFVTVTRVKLTDDLRQGHINVSILGTPEVRESSLKGLRAAAGYLRRELSHRLQLRFAPHLVFDHDDSLDHAQRVDDLLLASQRGEDDVPTPLDRLASSPEASTLRDGPMLESPPPPPKPKKKNRRRGGPQTRPLRRKP